jgi:hypothetical protein
MNALHIGFTKSVELPQSSYLFIDDDVPDIPHARIFDPSKHSLNPLKGITYKRARELADVLYTVSPQGENTLTVRNGRRALLRAFLTTTRLDKIKGDEEVTGMIQDMLVSPVLKSVLTKPTNFSFNPRSIILARINRAELGEFDALVLGLILIGHYKGQLVVPDLGFYGREAHVSLIREERLIAGVNYLQELPTRLRNGVLLIKDKIPSRVTLPDAETLAMYEGLAYGTNGYNDFVRDAIS